MDLTKNKKYQHFANKVLEYRDALGLRDWEIIVIAEEMEDRGRCYPNLLGRICTISAGIEFITDKDTTYEEIEKIAFHEVLETMLAPLVSEAERFYSKEYMEVMTHDIIQRVTNLVF